MKKFNLFRLIAVFVCFLMICALGTIPSKINKVIADNTPTIEYETPDEISVSDLMLNGKSVGNVVTLNESHYFSYNSNAAHKSVIFRFKYEVTALDVDPKVDELSCQFHFYTTWLENNGGAFWLRDDKNRILKSNDTGYVVTDAFDTLGLHDVELGKLYIKSGTNAGKYYLYIKEGTEVTCEYIIDSMPDTANLFTTGSNGNKIIDVNWTGNKITYISNHETYHEEFTQEFKLTAPADPVVENKNFLGWFDRLGNKWDFANDKVSGDTILTAAYEDASGTTLSDEEYFESGNFTPVLRFFASSDNHFDDTATIRDVRLAKAFTVAYKYASESTTYKKLDAAIFAGDLSDDGSPDALANWKRVIDENVQAGTQIVASMGNHEFRTYDSVTREIKAFEDAVGQKCDYHTVIGGYHFIALSPNQNEGYNFSNGKVQWLEEQLEIAANDTPNKPIFVLQHEHIKGTVYGSKDWGVDELTDVLCKYPQVVDFSGHSHFPLSDPRSIWQGTFTALGTGTLHFYEMGINGYKSSAVFPSDKTGGWSSGYSEASQAAEFQIVEVDANNAMRVIVYDLLNDREITRYYMRNLLDDIKFTYSHTDRTSKAACPTFDGSAAIVATAKENQLTVEFDQADYVGNDIVESYRIELYKGTKLVKTEYALSDYFFDSVPEKINIKIPNLEANTDYKIKVFAINVWNMESTNHLEATCKTGNLIIYKDVIDELTLSDLKNGSKYLTTDTLNSYKPVSFTPSEGNVYGSFKLTMQLLYVGADFQICFDEEFDNDDLIWVKQDGANIWFIKENYHSDEPMKPGLYIVEYQKRHVTENNVAYTIFSMKLVDPNKIVDKEAEYDESNGQIFYHEYKSSKAFSNNGKFSLNFNSCYAAGSRYYDIDYVVPRVEDPSFVKGENITLDRPFENWSTLGGAITFDSDCSSLDVWLEDSNGRITSNTTFNGKFTLSKSGGYYHYEIKTNKFDLAAGVTGNEKVTRVCFNKYDWKIANLDYIIYLPEVYDQYDEISMLDIGLPAGCDGIYSDSPTETGLPYAGTSPSYSAVLKYYLVCDDLNTKSEFRSQLGTLWSYFCMMWLQDGNPNQAFFGSYYSTRPSDKFTVGLQSHHIYLFETGTIRIIQGEWEGYNYTYLKVDNKLITGFYVPSNECKSTSYQVSFKIEDGGYTAADISLARNIEYIVDGEVYYKTLAISGCKIYEPTIPVVEGKYFTGWYTKENGGERVDFSNVFKSDDENVKYYARFSDSKYDVTFFSENQIYATQEVGGGGQALRPVVPTKEGNYKNKFVKWVIKGTETEFDFSSEINENMDLEAVFEEYQYRIVYRLDGNTVFTKYYQESNPTKVIGGEPEVPTYLGAEGYWDYAIEPISRTKGDTYAIARYNGVSMTTSSDISLNKFNGKEVDIADELTRFYLSFADCDAQGEWLVEYPVSGGHEKQDISFSWSDVSGNTHYVVYFADNEQFENSYIVRTEKTLLTDVGIFTPGETYYWRVVGEETNTVSAVDTFTILNTPVRWISAGTVFNTRDIGGWTTIDGKQVKYGMLYRGGQLELDQSGEASYMNDLSRKVFDYLGMKTEIELRGESTHTDNQFNEFEEMIHVNGQGYEQIFKLDANTCATYRTVFKALADESNYPFYFHCSWGADRTGFLGFAINALLGVPYEQLVQDFELTSISYSGRRTREATGFNTMVRRLLDEYPTASKTLKDSFEKYLIEYIGVTQAQIDSIRLLLLEPATEQATTHNVTYIVDGEVYLEAKIFDGGLVSSVAPVYFEKHFDCWLLDGEEFDVSTPVTKDLVLTAKYSESKYEDYDTITVRDLGIEDWNPCVSEPFNYEGTAVNGTRMFEFYYEITSEKGVLDDGVHVEVGNLNWQYKAHVWIAGENTQHVFTNGTGTPTLSATYKFEYGKTYKIQIGVVIPLDGDSAGKKVLYFIIDDEIICALECSPDLSSGYSVPMAGLQGVLHSTDNLKTVTFVNGEDSTSKQVTRGQLLTAIDDPETTLENMAFIGWYDSLGNKWDFATDKVLNDITLTARFGDKTIQALVLDDSDFEIVGNYEVRTGVKVSELEIPQVKDSLEFVGWYNGDTKLNDDDLISADMDNLICRFKVVEEKPVEPVDPTDPTDPTKPTSGCKGAATASSMALVALLGLLICKKEKRA